jgi:purine-binding chemotaxis protein CheW
MADIQYTTFFVAGHMFGIDVTEVQEVARHHAVTPVPLAAPAVAGLMNLRGQIITAIHLGERTGLSHKTANAPMTVIVRTAEGPVSLVVDRIGSVVTVSDSQFEQTPASLQGPIRDLISGTFKLDSHLLLALNVERTVSLAAA